MSETVDHFLYSTYPILMMDISHLEGSCQPSYDSFGVYENLIFDTSHSLARSISLLVSISSAWLLAP